MKIDKMKECDERAVPPFLHGVFNAQKYAKRKAELLDLFAREQYGVAPSGPFTVTGKIETEVKKLGGKALYQRVIITATDVSEGVSFSFPVDLVTPLLCNGAIPLILFFSFESTFTNDKYPLEEVCDRGVAVAKIYYEDIAIDETTDISRDVAALYPNGKYDWGKISMWAWAGSRALDYLLLNERFDKDKIASLGHSRLGKTSLWLGANDERVKYIFVCQSGCSGDALHRGKTGETLADIVRVFPCWFTPNFYKYANREQDLPFEQYMLIACCYPRRVYGSSAQYDDWADPKSEFLSYLYASEIYRALGGEGISYEGGELNVGDVFANGDIAFHHSPNGHFLSRHDWNKYIDYLLK